MYFLAYDYPPFTPEGIFTYFTVISTMTLLTLLPFSAFYKVLYFHKFLSVEDQSISEFLLIAFLSQPKLFITQTKQFFFLLELKLDYTEEQYFLAKRINLFTRIFWGCLGIVAILFLGK